jgi:hypothetical protein
VQASRGVAVDVGGVLPRGCDHVQYLVLGLDLLFQELDPLLFPLLVGSALALEGRRTVFEALFLPTVEHCRLQSVLLAEIRCRRMSTFCSAV